MSILKILSKSQSINLVYFIAKTKWKNILSNVNTSINS